MFDFVGIAKLASLLLLPFAHEDLAIVAGAYIVVNDMMPAYLVACGIYGGIIASDFALYGLGAGARRLPWLNGFADKNVRRFSATLKRNIFGLVALCRVVPGVVFVAFVACGWARVPLARFTLASVVVSALYLPLVLYLAIAFGDAVDDHIGFWAWPLLLSILFVAEFVRQRVFAFVETADAAAADVSIPVPEAGERSGMPALPDTARKVAAAERIPPHLFYAPLALNWIRLGIRYRSLTLPSAANPMIATGGMWGQSKSAYFDQLPAIERRAVADYVLLRRGEGAPALEGDLDRSLQYLADAGIEFPLVAKPDVGWHGYGVRRIDNSADLRAYLGAFPAGAKLMLQRFVPDPGEAAVLYARLPDDDRGRILSFALRDSARVVGDGVSTLRQLIRSDERARWKSRLHFGGDASHRGVEARELERVPARGEWVRIALIGNRRAGALYRDVNHCITAALEARFDALARSMREFHYGRFDLRFTSFEALLRGEDFSIVEIDGIGGEAIDAWDPVLPMRETYRRLAAHQRLLFMIGAANRARGFEPCGVGEFIAPLLRQTRLIQRYPASE
jgi:membrane protein DedA with SNARE-associated domain